MRRASEPHGSSDRSRRAQAVLQYLSHPRELPAISQREGITPELLKRWASQLEQALEELVAAGQEMQPGPAGEELLEPGRKRRRRTNYRHYPDEIIFTVCCEFAHGTGASAIAEWLRRNGYPQTSREQVYPMLSEGIDRSFLELHAPPEHDLRNQLARRFPLGAADIRVVNVAGPTLDFIIDHVAAEAARLVMELIDQYGARKRPIHIGFGAGTTIKQVARRLSQLLDHEREVPHLVLHALGSGFAPRDPSTSANTFFTFFEEAAARGLIEYEGLLADVFVPWDDYQSVPERPGIREAFDAKEKIDIVITTITSASDEHGLLHRFMLLAPPEGRKVLDDAGWVGDVLWRPFCQRGPIMSNTGIRAISVFELDELVRLAQTPDKHVIVVTGPCATCGRTRTDALMPILTQPGLRLCNHLVIDVATARELLKEA